MRLFGGVTVTDIERIDVTRDIFDPDNGEDVVILNIKNDPFAPAEIRFSLDVAEALQYALEQALR